MRLLAAIALLSLGPAAHAANCETLSRRLDRLIHKAHGRSLTCKKDRDCELVFHGNGDGCDLGVAASRITMGAKYFQKLDAARDAAETACAPTADPNPIRCMAEPFEKAVCHHGICSATY